MNSRESGFSNSIVLALLLVVAAAGAVWLALSNQGGGPTLSSVTPTSQLAQVGGSSAISFVRMAENKVTANSSNVASNAFSSVNQGDLLVAWVWYHSPTSSVSSVTDNAGDVFVKAVGPTRGANTMATDSQEIWYAKNVNGGSNVVVTANFGSGFNDEKAISVNEYSGADKIAPLDASAGNVGSSMNASSPAVTTTAPNDLIYGAGLFKTVGTAGSGFDQRSSIAQNATEDKIVASAGSSVTATFNNSAMDWLAGVAAFKAAVTVVSNPPVISSISAGTPSQTSATISWTTDQTASSQVLYGVTSAYGSQTATDPAPVTSHSATISGLSPGTVYHYAVKSLNSSGQSTQSPDQTFTTQATPITSYIITASAGTGGSISPAGNVAVQSGGSMTFTVAPNTGNQIISVVVDGSPAVGARNPVTGQTYYAFSNVTANHMISATFTTTNSTSFIVGQQVQVSNANGGLSVRSGPSTSFGNVSGSPEANGSVGTITAAPSGYVNGIPADGYYWWYVAYQNGVTGWSGTNASVNYLTLYVGTVPTYSVTVTKSGTGQGTVTGSSVYGTPVTINCGTVCSQTGISSGALMSLTATPTAGSVFAGWGGACSAYGTNPVCSVAETGISTANAVFNAQTVSSNISFVQLAENNATVNSNSITSSNFGSATKAGDTILAWIWYNSATASVSSVTDSAGDSFVRAVGPTTGANTLSGWRQEIWYAGNIHSGSAETVTANFNSTWSGEKAISAHEYSGANAIMPVDGTSASTGSTANASTGSVTTSGSNDLIFGAGLFYIAGTSGSGFTQHSHLAQNATEDKTVAAAGSSVAATFTNSAQDWIAQTVALEVSIGGGTPDNQAPSAPTGLIATAVSSSQINLAWTASTDNVGITGYNIYRNGANIGSSATNSYSDSGLSASTLYSYAVTAYDAAGNESGRSASASATTQAGTVISCTGNCPAYPLKLSANKRYLVDQNNKPFLMVGDSSQALVGVLSKAQADAYFADRQAHGFNATWVNLLCNTYTFCNSNGNTNSNLPAGESNLAPFTTAGNLSTPNQAYFQRVHDIIASAASHGILILLDPVETGGWLSTLTSNNSANQTGYGTYVGNFFKDLPNIIWMHGNDFQSYTNSTNDAAVYNVASGIKAADPNHIQTLELAFNNSTSLDDTTHSWGSILGLNAAYTYYPTYDMVLHGYNQAPTMPVFMVEANYEYEQNASSLDGGYPDSLRMQEYWTMLSGATGQLYGSCFTDKLSTVCNPTGTSGQIPNAPVFPSGASMLSIFDDTAAPSSGTVFHGVQELGYMANLFNSKAWYNLVPDTGHTVVTAGYGTYASTGGFTAHSGSTQSNYVTAASTPDGSLVMAYLPTTATITVNMAKLTAGSSVTARWFDPTNGTYTTVAGSPFANTGSKTFASPGNNSTGYKDWVLVLEASGGTAITPPSAPTGLTATASSSSQINLSWTASTAGTNPVSGYNIYMDGAATKTASVTTTSYSSTGLAANSTHSYAVKAYDTAGNEGAASMISATTQSGSSATFSVGQQVQVSNTGASGLSVRSGPSTSYAAVSGSPEANGSIGTVTLAPTGYTNGVSSDGYYWWYITYQDGVIGWSGTSATTNYLTSYVASTAYTLSLSAGSNGSISAVCGGVACPSNIPSGTSVTVTATPNSGYTASLSSVPSVCTGATSCTFPISANTAVTASFSPVVSGGACTSSSMTCTASGADLASVQNAVNVVPAGAIVNIPAGNATWSGQLNISKGIAVIGAGSGAGGTTINRSSSYTGSVVSISPPVGQAIRLSGFKFVFSDWTQYSNYPIAVWSGGVTRIDHNYFEKGSTVVTYTANSGFAYGVIDHNTFHNSNNSIQMNGNSTVWNTAVAGPIMPGSPNSLVIENNSFITDVDNTSASNQEDIMSGHGVRFIVRNNTFDSSAMPSSSGSPHYPYEHHGEGNRWTLPYDSNSLRGPAIYEIYGNTIKTNPNAPAGRFMHIRGGSGLIYNNALSGAGDPIQATQDFETTDYAPPEFTSWAGHDQIENTYIWGNTMNGSPITNIDLYQSSLSTFIQQNRDYFMHQPDATSGAVTWTDYPGSHNAVFTPNVPSPYYSPTAPASIGYNQLAYPDPYITNCSPYPTLCDTGSNVTQTYTLTASAGSNGSISPSGIVSVNSGTSQSFTITPNSGYQISSVIVDGSNVGAVSSYLFTNVTANHTISATFSQQSVGSTVTAASANYSDVLSAVNSAPSGATVIIPAGTATWSSTLSITKSIALIGQGTTTGSSLTKINSGASPLISINTTSDVPVRVSGISFDMSANSVVNGNVTGSAITVGGKNTHLRIDHSAFKSGTRQIFPNGYIYGVIDHNYFLDGNIGVSPEDNENGNNSNPAWTRPLAPGTAAALYIENNIFRADAAGGSNLNEQIYNFDAPRIVARYNTFDLTGDPQPWAFDAHGNTNLYSGTSNDDRGTMGMEIYNNTFINPGYRFLYLRGGSWLIHDNSVITTGGSNSSIMMTEEEGWTSGGTFGQLGLKNWPAQDQINNTFIWNNTLNGSPITGIMYNSASTDPIFIQQNRDYFMHAPQSTGGSESYPSAFVEGAMTFNSSGANAYYPYAPYAYPHPFITDCTNYPTLCSGGSPIPAAYSITASAGTGGTIAAVSGSTLTGIPSGSNQTVNITANSGYQISSVTVDGVNQGAISTYTFTNVTANHTITANFTSTASGGSCTSSTTNCTAASANLSDVQAAVNIVPRNATVNVPAGNASWSGTLSLTRGVKLIGAGQGNTVASNSGTLVNINPDATAIANDEIIRVEGFTFDGNNSALNLIVVNGAGASATKPYRSLVIVNNTFRNTSTITSGNGAITTFGQLRGVISTNTFDRVDVVLKILGNDSLTEWSNGHFPFAYGNSDNLFFENNTIKFSSAYSGQDSGWTETGQGARLVMRYNTWDMTNATYSELWDIHGFQNWHGSPTDNGQTGTMISEYYGNTVKNFTSYRWINHRGSWGMYFDNQISGTGGSAIQVDQYSANVPSGSGCETDVPGASGVYLTQVNNTYVFNNTNNGNLDSMAYGPLGGAANQCGISENTDWWNYNPSFNGTTGIGRGTTPPTGSCTVGTGYWVSSTPTPTTDPNVIQNGTFYKCTATNTWTAYYKPYTYPNPLISGGGVTQTFTLTASAGANGSVSPTSILVNQGASQVFNATPNNGFEVNQWLLDGTVVQTGGNTYTVSNVQAPHTVSVTFRVTVITGAISCDQATVQAAINSATNGSTVTCKAGSWTWSSPVTLANNVTLAGAGNGSATTTITLGIGNNISMSGGNRLTGFDFILGVKTNTSNNLVQANIGSTPLRIDHNIFDGDKITQGYAIDVWGLGTALIDNNTFYDNYGPIDITGDPQRNNYSWTLPSSLGSPNQVYVEHNHFLNTVNYLDAVDLYEGSRVVFRYNDVVGGTGIGSHGYDSDIESTFSFEVYNNTFNEPAAMGNWAWPMNWRGGSGVIYNNTSTGAYNAGIILENYRSDTGYTSAQSNSTGSNCDGTASVDGNTQPTSSYYGWPCHQQIGRGTNNSSDPLYIWNNTLKGATDNGSVNDPYSGGRGASYHILPNRDYFTGTPKPGYTPLSCPNPIIMSGPLADAKPDTSYCPAGSGTVLSVTVPSGSTNSVSSVNTINTVNAVNTVAAAPAASTVSSAFSVGEQVKVVNTKTLGLSVRSAPSLTASQVKGSPEANGSTGTITTPPSSYANGTYKNGYYWWYIKYSNGVTGWSVQGIGSTAYLAANNSSSI